MNLYKARVAVLREVSESLGLEVWHMSDSVFVRRLCRGTRVAALLQDAKARGGQA
jgi:hypothetical protein